MLALTSPALVAAFALKPPALSSARGNSRFFLDTAVTSEWEELLPLGIFHGVTTNPTLLKRAGLSCTVDVCRELYATAEALGADEAMFQAWGATAEQLVETGMALSEINTRSVVVKVPVTATGTTAAAELVRRGVRVCLTACFAREQALVAAAVGAEYIAPYLGRMTDNGKDGLAEVKAMQAICDGLGSETRIFVASIRDADEMSTLAAEGLDSFTFSPAVARALFSEPLTTAAAAVFEEDARRSGAAVGA